MKILIYGLPKTGTTILFFKIQKAFQQKFLNEDIPTIFEPSYIRHSGEKQILGKSTGHEVSVGRFLLTKALVPVLKGPGLSFEDATTLNADRTILIVRDPRDRWISGIFYRWFTKCEELPSEFAKIIKLAQFKEENPSALPTYALRTMNQKILAREAKRQHRIMRDFDKIIRHARTSNWLIFKYEDLVEGNFSALNEYLGMTVSDGEVSESFSRVARSKKADNWRQWFTEEDVDYLKPVFTPFLRDMGYNEEDWALCHPTTLDPKQGSEYLKSLAGERKKKYTIGVKKIINRILGKNQP